MPSPRKILSSARSDPFAVISMVAVLIAYIYAVAVNPVLALVLTGITVVVYIFFTRGEDNVEDR